MPAVITPTSPSPSSITLYKEGQGYPTFDRGKATLYFQKVNDKVAEKLGLKNGDKVALVNQDGVKSSTTTTVKVTPGIRQDCVYLYHGFGSMSPELTIGHNKGISGQSLITKMSVDPETGCNGMRNNFVKIVKVS